MALLEADVGAAVAAVRDFIALREGAGTGAEVAASLSPWPAWWGSSTWNSPKNFTGEAYPSYRSRRPRPTSAWPLWRLPHGRTAGCSKTTILPQKLAKQPDRQAQEEGDPARRRLSPAAIEQLQTVTKQAGAEWFPSEASDKPLVIARPRWTMRNTTSINWLVTPPAPAPSTKVMAEIRHAYAALKPVEDTRLLWMRCRGRTVPTPPAPSGKCCRCTQDTGLDEDGRRRGGALSVIIGAPIKFAGQVRRRSTGRRFSMPSATPAACCMGDIVALVEAQGRGRRGCAASGRRRSSRATPST